MENRRSRLIWIILAIAVAVVAFFSLRNCLSSNSEVKYSSLKEIASVCSEKDTHELDIGTLDEETLGAIKNNEVYKKFNGITKIAITNVLIDNYTVSFTFTVTYSNSARTTESRTYYAYYSRSNDSVAELEGFLTKAGVPYTYTNPNAGSIWSSLLPILGFIVVAVIFFILMMQTQGGTKGAMNFAKTNARVQQNLKVRFSDVAGAEEEKEELAEVVEFLKHPGKFSELGARIPKGVLLVGPPGTGKTLFAKAVAGEAGVPFFSISGSDFVEMFVGVGASRVRDLFDVAKKSMPCIVFIDEIDAVGRQRGTGMGGGHDEREQTLNQLLVQMDGFETNEGIIVMAATNRADILDPALLRPGRFDRQIYVNIPDVKGREAILKVHARNKPMAKDVNFKTVARITSGFSGADLENLLNEAAILAARAGRKAITNKDLYEGINKVVIGPQKKSRLVTETDKRITAYHESGHAILAKLLKHCDPVHEVSIIPRGQAAGYTMTRPDTDDNHLTKAKLLDDIVMSLGGRVAEELVIKDISAGASGDIQAVSKRARLMVTEWGMSEKVGPISYGSEKEIFIGRDMASHVNYSEETAALIDEEVRKIVEDALQKARKLLGENRKLLDTMARLLVERETIYSEEVEMIMAGKSVEEIIAFMDGNENALSEDPFGRMERSSKIAEENAENSEKADAEKVKPARKKKEEEKPDNKTEEKKDEKKSDGE